MKREEIKEEGYYWATTKRSPRGIIHGYRTIVRLFQYDREKRWYVQHFGAETLCSLDELKDYEGPITELKSIA